MYCQILADWFPGTHPGSGSSDLPGTGSDPDGESRPHGNTRWLCGSLAGRVVVTVVAAIVVHVLVAVLVVVVVVVVIVHVFII